MAEKDNVKRMRSARVTIVSDHVTETAWARFHSTEAVIVDQDNVEHRLQRDFIERGHAVAVLAYCAEKGTVLLVEQFRLPAYINDARDAVTIEVCGGMMEQGSAIETATNEAREELGVALAELEEVFTAYSSPGTTTEKVSCFLGRYAPDTLIPAAAGNAQEDESIVVREFTYAQVQAAIREGVVCDARTVALFYYLMATQGMRPA